MKATIVSFIPFLWLFNLPASAESCSKVIVPPYPAPSVAGGWQAQLVAAGLQQPRSIGFDSNGGLLVIESGKGLSRLSLSDQGDTCLEVEKSDLLIDQPALNHGLAISNDSKTIYASSVDSVFSWDYDAEAGKISSNSQVLVSNMGNNELSTRTLLLSRKASGFLVVSRGGSDDNPDAATVLSSGASQIRSFNLTNITTARRPDDFGTSGLVLGWGLRNSVGVAEHPVTGGIYSVENSIDDVTRRGADVHERNPGEELNFHGYLGGPTRLGAVGSGNYGYPRCFAVWDAGEIPDGDGLKVGKQFASANNDTVTDKVCARDYVAPRLTFPAHEAPIDIKFSPEGDAAYISFHGSFNTKKPVGYRLSTIEFNPTTGQPKASSDSTNALSDIMSNKDTSACPDQCFRPAGLAWDAQGRLWMTSDTTGEIYVLQKKEGSNGIMVGSAGRPNSGADALLYGIIATISVTAWLLAT